mgnify:CR=1 FL=1
MRVLIQKEIVGYHLVLETPPCLSILLVRLLIITAGNSSTRLDSRSYSLSQHSVVEGINHNSNSSTRLGSRSPSLSENSIGEDISGPNSSTRSGSESPSFSEN